MNDIIKIRRIGEENEADARILNEPFTVWGRMIPVLQDGIWKYDVKQLPEPFDMCFPNEDYRPLQDDASYFGAYDGEACIGLAILRRDWFKYLYLDDLKVNREYRGKGVGRLLIEACMNETKEKGMIGVYTIGQDNNASACLFYLSMGFEIGGFDNRSYRGTKQEEKANIFFYRDCR